jgi:hypothetical protein
LPFNFNMAIPVGVYSAVSWSYVNTYPVQVAGAETVGPSSDYAQFPPRPGTGAISESVGGTAGQLAAINAAAGGVYSASLTTTTSLTTGGALTLTLTPSSVVATPPVNPSSPTNPTVLSPATPTQAGQATNFRPQLNNYVSAVEQKVMLTQSFVEKLGKVLGFGWISGGDISKNSGNYVTVTSFEAIVGNYVSTNSSQIVGGFSDGVNYLWLRQSGLMIPTPTSQIPTDVSTHGAALLWGTVSSSGGLVTSVDNTRAIFGQNVTSLYQDAANQKEILFALVRSLIEILGDDVISEPALMENYETIILDAP